MTRWDWAGVTLAISFFAWWGFTATLGGVFGILFFLLGLVGAIVLLVKPR